jgi:hypothetical protein
MPKMSAREVRAEFNRQWAERVREVPAYANDKPAARQFWSVMLDDLLADGRITEHMLQNVTYPASID